MTKRAKAARLGLMVGVAAAVLGVSVAFPLAGTALAATTVTIPSGPFTDGQSVTVSGTGFPVRSALPTGLEILECADTGGLSANLPTDATTGCDGSTVNGSQINTDASGNFSASYAMVLLNSGNSTITCDATHFCVLWVGVDYNNAFLSGPHGFSTPFKVNSAPAQTPEAPLVIALPLLTAAIVGAYVFLRRRRHGKVLSA